MKLDLIDKCVLGFTIIATLIVISLPVWAGTHGGYGVSDYEPEPEIWLGEVTDEHIIINWMNRRTLAQTRETLTFETEHGNVVLTLERTRNKKPCDSAPDKATIYCALPAEEAADIIRVVDTPDGWISELGWEITMYEEKFGHFRIIPWSGM